MIFFDSVINLTALLHSLSMRDVLIITITFSAGWYTCEIVIFSSLSVSEFLSSYFSTNSSFI